MKPAVCCPECGSPETLPIANVKPERGAPDPGEVAIYQCQDDSCGWRFIDVVP